MRTSKKSSLGFFFFLFLFLSLFSLSLGLNLNDPNNTDKEEPLIGAPSSPWKNRLATIVAHTVPAAAAPAAAAADAAADAAASAAPPLHAMRTRKRSRGGTLGAPVAFASRGIHNKKENDEEERELVGLQQQHFPLVSCTAAKALVCIGGIAAVGAAVSKLTSNYLRRKRRENMRREGPPSPFNRLLGPVLLEGPGAAEAAATAGSAAAAAAGAGAAGGSTSSILSFFRPKNKFKEIFTNSALGEKGSLTALYFTGKGVEQILQAKGYVPFTPRLESIVRAAKQNGKKLNVVFISADNSPNDAADLFNTMPWYAVPFDDEEGRSITRSLYRKFRVSSLPHITLLDEQGKVVNPQAYTALLTDPLGFPWKKKSILQLIGNKLQDNKGQPVDPAVLKGKTIGLYFSASWCGPCRNFTPKLMNKIRKIKEKGEEIELIFISNDRDEESFKQYSSSMDALAIPYSETATRAVLQDALGVRSLPTLIWVNPEGEIITRRGVSAIIKEGDESLGFPWQEKLIKDIDDALDVIAEEPVLLTFLNNADNQQQQQTLKALEEAAVALKGRKDGESVGPLPQFLLARSSSPRTAALRHICKEGFSSSAIKPNNAVLLILDIFTQKVYPFPHDTKEVTKENIVDFVNKYQNEELNGKPLTLPE